MAEIKISPDGFASEHFGVQIGKIAPEVFDGDYDEIKAGLTEAQKTGFDVLMTRTSSHRVRQNEVLKLLKGKIFDILITSTLYPTKAVDLDFPSDSIAIESSDRLTDTADIDMVRRIGSTAFDLTHFHNDPRLSVNGWLSFYGAWSVNDVTNRAKQTVIARSEDSGEVVGFTTLLAYKDEPTPYGIKTLGMVDLVAVAEKYRGQGIGTRLVAESTKWLADNVDMATVGTESVNFPAFAVYQKCGFIPTYIAYSYHLWLDKALN